MPLMPLFMYNLMINVEFKKLPPSVQDGGSDEMIKGLAL
jgi:hypothetical protein